MTTYPFCHVRREPNGYLVPLVEYFNLHRPGLVSEVDFDGRVLTLPGSSIRHPHVAEDASDIALPHGYNDGN